MGYLLKNKFQNKPSGWRKYGWKVRTNSRYITFIDPHVVTSSRDIVTVSHHVINILEHDRLRICWFMAFTLVLFCNLINPCDFALCDMSGYLDSWIIMNNYQWRSEWVCWEMNWLPLQLIIEFLLRIFFSLLFVYFSVARK